MDEVVRVAQNEVVIISTPGISIMVDNFISDQDIKQNSKDLYLSLIHISEPTRPY